MFNPYTTTSYSRTVVCFIQGLYFIVEHNLNYESRTLNTFLVSEAEFYLNKFINLIDILQSSYVDG